MIIAARIWVFFLLLAFSAFHLFRFFACIFTYTSFFHIDDHDAIFFSEILRFFSLNSNLKIDDSEFEKLKKKLKNSFDSEKMIIRKKKNLCFANEKFYLKNFDRNFDSNEFHSVEISIDYLSCNLLRMTNRVTNWTKNECASLKCFSQKSIFLCRCDRISLDYFEAKIYSMMYEKNENVFEMQMKNENVFAIKKSEILQLIVFFWN